MRLDGRIGREPDSSPFVASVAETEHRRRARRIHRRERRGKLRREPCCGDRICSLISCRPTVAVGARRQHSATRPNTPDYPSDRRRRGQRPVSLVCRPVHRRTLFPAIVPSARALHPRAAAIADGGHVTESTRPLSSRIVQSTSSLPPSVPAPPRSRTNAPAASRPALNPDGTAFRQTVALSGARKLAAPRARQLGTGDWLSSLWHAPEVSNRVE